MKKSIKETRAKAPFLPKEISDEDLLARYTEHQASNPIRPKIAYNADSTATIVTTYFEDADPKEFAAVLAHEEVPEIDLEPEDPDAFNLYSPNRDKDGIDWEDNPTEEAKPAEVAVKEKLSGPAKRRDKRLKALAKSKGNLITAAQQVIDEQASLAAAIAASANPSADEELKRRTILAELQLYVLGVNSRNWAHKNQAIEEEIDFAETAAGKEADEKADVEFKAARVLKEKEKKKQRKTAKKAGNEKGRKGKGKGRNGDVEYGSDEQTKLGRYIVGGKKIEKEKTKPRGADLNRVNKSGILERGGRGERDGSPANKDGRRGRRTKKRAGAAAAKAKERSEQ